MVFKKRTATPGVRSRGREIEWSAKKGQSGMCDGDEKDGAAITRTKGKDALSRCKVLRGVLGWDWLNGLPNAIRLSKMKAVAPCTTAATAFFLPCCLRPRCTTLSQFAQFFMHPSSVGYTKKSLILARRAENTRKVHVQKKCGFGSR